jgi:AraC-like DNA-binding protein
LAGQLIAFGMVHLVTFFYYFYNHGFYFQLFGIDYFAASLVGPLVYLFTCFYINDNTPGGIKLWKHFALPIIIFLAYSIAHISYLKEGLKVPTLDITWFSRIQYLADSVVFLQGFIYIGVAYYLYRKALKKLKFKKNEQLKWLKVYYISTIIFVVITAPMGLIENGKLAGIHIAVFSLVYFIILIWASMSSSVLFDPETLVMEESAPISDEARFLMEIIESKKMFTNKDFTIEMLAEQLSMSKHQVLAAFNGHLRMTFNDYINELRVKESKLMLLDSAFEQFTIEAIGHQAGFSSRSTFYDAFKKYWIDSH